MPVDHKTVEIEFKNDGVHLTHSTVTVQQWWDKLAVTANSLVPVVDPVQLRPKDNYEAKELYNLGFNPLSKDHRLPVKSDRVTHIQFHVKPLGTAQVAFGVMQGWLFCEPGFKLKDVSKEHESKFKNKQIWWNKRVVSVTYAPTQDDYGKWYSYELWLEAPCFENGQPNGHMIIIIDPIISSDEV